MALAVVARGTLLSVLGRKAQVAVALSKGSAVWPRWLVGMAQNFLQFFKIKAIKFLLVLAKLLLCCTQILRILQSVNSYICTIPLL